MRKNKENIGVKYFINMHYGRKTIVFLVTLSFVFSAFIPIANAQSNIVTDEQINEEYNNIKNNPIKIE